VVTQTVDMRGMTFSPTEVATLALDEIRACCESRHLGITMGWERINQRLKPIRPGNLCTIIAYTSNYKTGLMVNWARRIANEIIDGGAAREDEVVVYVSWEDTVESMGVYDLANDALIDVSEINEGRIDTAAMARLEAAAMRRGALPLWAIGHSGARRKKAQPMTMSMVESALEWIEEQMGRKVTAIFLDYVNLIVPESKAAWGENRRTDIMENTFRARSLALARGCPVIMGAQAGRQTNERAWKLPQKWDAQESSAIEQYSDVMLSTWLPATTEDNDRLEAPNGVVLDVTPNLLILGLLKQKRGPAGGWWPMYVDPARNEIAPMRISDDGL